MILFCHILSQLSRLSFCHFVTLTFDRKIASFKTNYHGKGLDFEARA